MSRHLLALTILVGMSSTFASSGSEHHEAGIPSVILWQFVNLAILFYFIIKYTKEPIIQTFRNRREEYIKQAEKYKIIYEEKEKEYLDVKHRLENLEATASESFVKAQKEANEIKNQILKDAKENAGKIYEDAIMTSKVEQQKALRKLQELLIQSSVSAARALLTKDIGMQDHQKLQTEFNKNMEVVSP